MKKKKISLLLAAVLLTSSIAACNTDGTTSTTDGSQNGTSSSADSTDTSSEGEGTTTEGTGETSDVPHVLKAENLHIGEYFPLDEEITIQVAGVREDISVPFEEVVYFKELEKATNVKVEWLDWPQIAQKERRSLAFAGGDLPDAFYGSWSFDKPDVVNYGTQNQLLDLTPYLTDEVMPNVSKLLNDVEGLRNSLEIPSGGLYALPTLDQNGLPKTNDTLVINTDWLEKVGKEMPTTVDEFIDVLRAFKEAGDINGNGQADEIPFSFLYDGGNNGAFGLMGFTGIPAQNRGTKMVMKDGTPKFYPALDEYKTYLTFLNKLHSEGLLDPEVFTMDQPTYNAKTQNPEPYIGVISTWTAESVNRPIEGFNSEEEGVYQYVKPLQGEEGVEPKWGRRINPLNGNLSFAIAGDTEYPEQIAAWIDLAYHPETSITTYIGVEGVTMEKDGDQYKRILKEDGTRYSKPDFSDLVPGKMAVAWVKPDVINWSDDIQSPQNKNAADALYEPYIEMNYVNDYIMATEEENDRVAQLTTDIFPYVDQSTANFVTQGGIEEGWEAYIQQLKDLGLEEYEEIKTNMHNRATAE